MKVIYTFLFFFTLLFTSVAQIPAIQLQQAQAELEKRGISEEELRTRLLQKGINIDQIDPSNPNQVKKVQKAVEEAIAELESEKAMGSESGNNSIGSGSINNDGGPITPKAQKGGEPTIEETTENIREAVEDGATVEEALSEEATDATQRELPPAKIYGQQLFRNQSLKLYRTTNDAKPPDSYILGVGDEISVSIFGISQADFTFEIPTAGFIKPTGMPRILLKGIPYGQAKKLLRNRFSAAYVFQPEQFAVTINTARTITVNIFGEAINFGSFNISALNTAVNALVAAGGPSDIGSVRNIQVISNGVSKRLDVYEFMNDPSIQFDFFLNNNDIISIPVAQRLVEIEGGIRRPFIYELIEGENLKQLIEYAGGFTNNAYKANLQIQRFENDKQIIIDVNWNELARSGQDFKLQSGDIVSINTIERSFENFVSIEGAVEAEGQFQLENNMRITDLLEKGQLRPEARTDVAFLLRTNPDQTVRLIKINLQNLLENPSSSDNLMLQAKDQLTIYSLERFTEQATITIKGAVRDSSEIYTIDPDRTIRVQEAIILAGGLTPEATDFAYIIRRDSLNQSLKEYLRVDLASALAQPNSAANLSLQAYDELNIPSDATYTNISTVEIQGAVRQPGEFQHDKSLTLKDLLTLAGGLKLEASSSRIDIFRLVIKENESTKTVVATLQVDENLQMPTGEAFLLEPYDLIVVREVPDFEFQQNIRIEGEVRYPGTYTLVGDNEKLLSVLKRAGGLTTEAFPSGTSLYREEDNTGFIVTQLDKVIKNPLSRFNYVLKAGDVITIPKSKDLVSIELDNSEAAELYPEKLLGSGKVNIAYKDGKTAKWYVDEFAAGVDRKKGRKRLISVEHPNGQIEKARNFIVFQTYPKTRPGSIIKIGAKPVKPEKEKREKESVDWEKIVANSIAQVSSILTLAILIRQLNR